MTGRICGGIVQVGERLRVLPGDESGLVRREFQSTDAFVGRLLTECSY